LLILVDVPCISLGWGIYSSLHSGNIWTPRDFVSTENGTGYENGVASFSQILGFFNLENLALF